MPGAERSLTQEYLCSMEGLKFGYVRKKGNFSYGK
jgi:hypothetical protein